MGWNCILVEAVVAVGGPRFLPVKKEGEQVECGGVIYSNVWHRGKACCGGDGVACAETFARQKC